MQPNKFEIIIAIALPSFPSLSERQRHAFIIHYLCGGLLGPNNGYDGKVRPPNHSSRDRYGNVQVNRIPDESRKRFYPFYGASPIRRGTNLFRNGRIRGTTGMETRIQRRERDLAVLASAKAGRRGY